MRILIRQCHIGVQRENIDSTNDNQSPKSNYRAIFIENIVHIAQKEEKTHDKAYFAETEILISKFIRL